MKQKIVFFLCILLAVILLLPIPMRLKDGGTVEYSALLYRIQDVHRLNPDLSSGQEFLEGTIIEIFGVEVFNNVK